MCNSNKYNAASGCKVPSGNAISMCAVKQRLFLCVFSGISIKSCTKKREIQQIIKLFLYNSIKIMQNGDFYLYI